MAIFPLVTTIVLTYQNFCFLKKSINSIFAQDYPKIELIISDDGSTNYNPKYIVSLLKNKPKNIVDIKIIHHEENLGTVKNLNKCIAISKGDYYIGLAGDDEFFDNSVISKIVTFFKQNSDALICTTRRQLITKDDKEVAVLPKKKDIRFLKLSPENLFPRLCWANFLSGSCTFSSRKLFQKYGYYDERYKLLEDYPMYLKLSRNREKIYYLDKISVKHRQGGISTSQFVDQAYYEDNLRVIKNEILPHLNNKKIYDLKLAEYDISKNKSKYSFKSVMKYHRYYLIKFLEKTGFFKLKPEFFL